MSAKMLVDEVLQSLREPFGPHVIDDVYREIEKNERWKAKFDGLADGYEGGQASAAKVIAGMVSRKLDLAEKHDKRCKSKSNLAQTYTRMRVL